MTIQFGAFHSLSSYQGTPRVIPGTQIAQHQVKRRIEKVEVYPSGNIIVWIEGGDKATSIFLRTRVLTFSTHRVLFDYLDHVHWVATQNAEFNEYYLTVRERGLLGAGVGSSKSDGSGKCDPSKLSAEMRNIFNYRKKANPTASDTDILTDILFEFLPNHENWPTYTGSEKEILWKIEWIQELLAAGADPNSVSNHSSVLYRVIHASQKYKWRGHAIKTDMTNEIMAVVKLLIQAGAKVTINDVYDSQRRSHYIQELFDLLFSKLEINSEVSGKTPLECAIGLDEKLALMLIEVGADVHKGCPQVHAVRYMRVEVARKLIEKKVDLNKKTPLEASPNVDTCAVMECAYLLNAKSYIHERLGKAIELFKILSEARADVKVRDSEGHTVFTRGLVYSKSYSDYSIQLIPVFLASGFKPEEGMHCALEFSFEDILYYHRSLAIFIELVKAGAPIDYVDSHEPLTCLQKLCKKNVWDQVNRYKLRELLRLKAKTQLIEGEIFQALPEDVQELIPELFQKTEAYQRRKAQEEVKKRAEAEKLEALQKAEAEKQRVAEEQMKKAAIEAEQKRILDEQRKHAEHERQMEELKRLEEVKKREAELEEQRQLKKAEEERIRQEEVRKRQAELEAQKKAKALELAQKIAKGLSGDVYAQLVKVNMLDQLCNRISSFLLEPTLEYIYGDSVKSIKLRREFAEQLTKAIENILNKKTFFNPDAAELLLDWRSMENQVSELLQEWNAARALASQEEERIARIEQNQRDLEKQNQHLGWKNSELLENNQQMRRQLQQEAEAKESQARRLQATERLNADLLEKNRQTEKQLQQETKGKNELEALVVQQHHQHKADLRRMEQQRVGEVAALSYDLRAQQERAYRIKMGWEPMTSGH